MNPPKNSSAQTVYYNSYMYAVYVMRQLLIYVFPRREETISTPPTERKREEKIDERNHPSIH
jgi:hypothetical protein